MDICVKWFRQRCGVVVSTAWGPVKKSRVKGKEHVRKGPAPKAGHLTISIPSTAQRKRLRKTTTSENVGSVHMGDLGTPRVAQPWENKD